MTTHETLATSQKRSPAIRAVSVVAPIPMHRLGFGRHLIDAAAGLGVSITVTSVRTQRTMDITLIDEVLEMVEIIGHVDVLRQETGQRLCLTQGLSEGFDVVGDMENHHAGSPNLTDWTLTSRVSTDMVQ